MLSGLHLFFSIIVSFIYLSLCFYPFRIEYDLIKFVKVTVNIVFIQNFIRILTSIILFVIVAFRNKNKNSNYFIFIDLVIPEILELIILIRYLVLMGQASNLVLSICYLCIFIGLIVYCTNFCLKKHSIFDKKKILFIKILILLFFVIYIISSLCAFSFNIPLFAYYIVSISIIIYITKNNIFNTRNGSMS